MISNWTFGRKVAFGFSVSSLFLIIVGIVGYWSTYALIDTSYSVTHTHKVMEQIASYLSNMKDAETGQRGYLLTGDPAYLEPHTSAVEAAPKLLNELRSLTIDNPKQQRLIDQIETLTDAKFSELARTITLKKNGHSDDVLKLVLSNEGKTIMDNLRKVTEQMSLEERGLLEKRATEAEATAATAKKTILASTLICLLFVTVTAFMMTRTLATQLGAAVGHVQSSSTELQAAATQQASGAKEQASAMNEISTTISELGVTSRQIAESAQRVAQIAEQTAKAARAGEVTVKKATKQFQGFVVRSIWWLVICSI